MNCEFRISSLYYCLPSPVSRHRSPEGEFMGRLAIQKELAQSSQGTRADSFQLTLLETT
jgi:hypothetical protein